MGEKKYFEQIFLSWVIICLFFVKMLVIQM